MSPFVSVVRLPNCCQCVIFNGALASLKQKEFKIRSFQGRVWGETKSSFVVF